MTRDFGHDVSGLGPKQTVDDVARAIVGCIRRPRPEVYPHALSRGSTRAQHARARLHGLVRPKRFGRRRDAV